MALNPNIILAGQQPDIVNALARSTQAAGMAQQVQQEAKKNAFLGQNGAALMAGDPQALSGFARFDPVNATNMLAKRQDMTMQAQANERDASKYKTEIAKSIREWDEATLKSEQAQMDAFLKNAASFMMQNNLEGVNQVFSEAGLGPVKNLDEARAVVIRSKDARDMIEAEAKMRAPLSQPGMVQADIDRGNLPPGTPLRSPGAKVEVNNNAPVDDSEALKSLDREDGKAWAAILQSGREVPATMAQIDRLEELLMDQTTPEGMEAGIKAWLGDYGLPTEGLSNLQAARAVISKLVPAQREQGSGSLSDKDMLGFQQSLPRLINTREGNKMIIDALRGIQVYNLKQAEIARAVANREITLAEGRERAAAVENPLEVFRKPGATSIGGYAKITSQEEYDALPPGTVFIDAETGKTKRKP